MGTEEWRPVVGWEGLYEVSNLGLVRSLPRQTRAGMRGGRVLAQAITSKGYRQVGLYRDGVARSARVHVLVLEAFAGPRPAGMEARHGPGGKLDNRLVNLRWGTPPENWADKWRDGTAPYGERVHNARLTVALVAELREQRAGGVTVSELARTHRVARATIRRAVDGRTWSRVP